MTNDKMTISSIKNDAKKWFQNRFIRNNSFNSEKMNKYSLSKSYPTVDSIRKRAKEKVTND